MLLITSDNVLLVNDVISVNIISAVAVLCIRILSVLSVVLVLSVVSLITVFQCSIKLNTNSFSTLAMLKEVSGVELTCIVNCHSA